jgi:catechol 2,3-dioxygenase-like lactoylglutathione lyase family enzyme
MILGLSHVALTVNNLDESILFYQRFLDVKVLSDAERKGEWIDKVTGIPGFHSRTVYLSITPYQHLELFGFFNPPTLSVNGAVAPKVGIVGCDIIWPSRDRPWPATLANNSDLDDVKSGETYEEPFGKCSLVNLKDPDGLNYRILMIRQEPRNLEFAAVGVSICPKVVTQDIQTSLRFYRDVLGLKIATQGTSTVEGESIEWILIKGTRGVCLRLVKPLAVDVLPMKSWKMERIGFTHVAFAVNGLEKFYKDLSEKGVSFRSPPQAVSIGPHEGGRVVYLSCPEGVTLEFIESPLTVLSRDASSTATGRQHE